ncbi:hypothetical protein F4778DRAFT_780578 [Xylariomycetidae sp. FL2044]|nr:hypothetical protein F4778DRAFT_780578 [Xylariomycetidae sp. FL2044]
MPRKKNNSKPYRPKGPPLHVRRKLGLSDNAQGNAQHPARPHGYTLAEEARNTASNRSGFLGRDAKLRHKPVTFVSAGFINPLKELDVQPDKSDKPQELPKPATQVPDDQENISPKTAAEERSPPVFTIDTTGDKSLRPQIQAEDRELDLEWDSSEEILLFKGRNPGRRKPRPHASDRDGNEEEGRLGLRDMNLELQKVQDSLGDTQEPRKKFELPAVGKASTKGEPARDEVAEANDFISFGTYSKANQRARKTSSGIPSDDEEAAIIADYMANIQDDSDDSNAGDEDEDHHPGLGSFHMRDLGGTDSDAVPEPVSSENESRDMSEEDEDEDTMRNQLLADDELMAHVLAKQEELGLVSDNMGDASDDNWTISKGTPRRRKKGSSKKAKIVQKKGQFPSATEMADAFDDLDLMDWHRPSLNNFKKASKTFDVSDSELEEAMNLAFRKDRLKKAEKKKAREELRSQGLLGKNIDPDDLRVKYRGGLSLDDLANELETFLLGSQEQLAFPPLDRDARRIIHLVANKLQLRTRSAGKGDGRYPVLYRSKATAAFNADTFDRVFKKVKRPWFPRVDVDEKVVNEAKILRGAEGRTSKSRYTKNSLTLREGDIVGQHAAELGSENKGRAMLEKMGWSKGMALGHEENKGIMVPITHVVKKTKAGLGDA